jgi:3-methyladenine DNA glycosylase AlkC
MAPIKKHPAERFKAPTSIQSGIALKDMFERPLVELIAESFAEVVPRFQVKQFIASATLGLKQLELKQRAQLIAAAMAEQLPADFAQAAPLLIESLGPELQATEGNGLAVFFYLPHAQYIATWGVSCFKQGMTANYELTKRFTAEFSVRPFLIQHRGACLELLSRWTNDASSHVRRLVSEGTRPRLPWAMRLPEFQQNPAHTLPLLERLKDDSELYVRRSVANHLGDLAKDHLEVVLQLCERWLQESAELEPTAAENRRWVIRHALRHPAKNALSRAEKVRQKAAAGKPRSNRKSAS